MKRLLSLLFVFFLLTFCVGCGSKFFVRGAINTGTVSGTVSTVELTTVIEDGTSVNVTLVTFLQSETSNSVTFCGDQRMQFPLDQLVSATFTTTQPCANIVQIVVG